MKRWEERNLKNWKYLHAHIYYIYADSIPPPHPCRSWSLILLYPECRLNFMTCFQNMEREEFGKGKLVTQYYQRNLEDTTLLKWSRLNHHMCIECNVTGYESQFTSVVLFLIIHNTSLSIKNISDKTKLRNIPQKWLTRTPQTFKLI